MSYLCEYCNTKFDYKSHLTRHQQTAKYCLDIQQKLGITIPEPRFKCPCGETFTRKNQLERHFNRCQQKDPVISQSSITNIGIGTQNVINNNIVINLFGSTWSSLTPEIVSEKILSNISVSDIESGLKTMTEAVAPAVFKNEKNNWMVRVADSSRNKFELKTDSGVISDVGGQKTSALLKTPLIKATLIAADKSKKPDEIKQTIDDIKNSETYTKQTVGTLVKIVPARFEAHDSDIKIDPRKEEIEQQKALDRALAKINKKIQAKDEEEYQKWKNEMLNNSQPLFNESFWHPQLHFILEVHSTLGFVIIGKRKDRFDKTMPLSKEDIEKIHKMKLEKHIKGPIIEK